MTVDDNLVQHLRVEVDGDTLRIGLDPAYDYRDTDLTATVAMPKLTALEVTGGSSGAGMVAFAGMRAGKVVVNVSGAGKVSGQLDAEQIGGQVSPASSRSRDRRRR